MRQLVIDAGMQVTKETGQEYDYLIGTMIEIPQAALTADQIANEADFSPLGQMINALDPALIIENTVCLTNGTIFELSKSIFHHQKAKILNRINFK